jgi:hypothetical protein
MQVNYTLFYMQESKPSLYSLDIMAKLSKYIWPLFAQCGYLDDALDKLLKNAVYILFHTHSHRLLDTGVVGTT